MGSVSILDIGLIVLCVDPVINITKIKDGDNYLPNRIDLILGKT